MTKKLISDHITIYEATRSITAIRNGIDNTPSESNIANMKALADNIFEPVRNHFKRPIRIASFYRCNDLNYVIGGAPNSQHKADNGAAMDIDNDGYNPTNRDIFDYIKDNLEFDQMIWEYGDDECPDWVHVSYVSPIKDDDGNVIKNSNRNQILRAYSKPPKYRNYKNK